MAIQEQHLQEVQAPELTVVVEAEQYEDALHDPKVRETLERADALLRAMEAEKRSF